MVIAHQEFTLKAKFDVLHKSFARVNHCFLNFGLCSKDDCYLAVARLSTGFTVLVKLYINLNVIYVVAAFKKMLVQKRKEQLKAFEKQEKQIKEDKASGKSKKQAVRTCIAVFLDFRYAFAISF